MIPFNEALDIALSSARALDTESVELAQARNRILAQELRADMSMPPYDKAMVECQNGHQERSLAAHGPPAPG